MYTTLEPPISLNSLKNELLAAFNTAQLTALKHQYGENQIQRVWQTLNDAEKAKIQALCSIEATIKQQLLASSSQNQLTAIKHQYSEHQIQQVWKTLTDSEKRQIKALCRENQTHQPPQVEIDQLHHPQMINHQLLTNYLEGEDFEDKALELAQILKNAQAYLVRKMLAKNYKSLQNEQISISLRKKPKTQEYSLILKLINH
jgi:hypothetical protein